MKHLTLLLIIGLSLLALNCELMEDEHTFHLVYSVTSLDNNPVDIEVVYKVGNEYVTEQTQTPFIYEQDIELDKAKDENYYYYLEINSSYKNNINIQIISNDKKLHDTENIINPIMFGGFIGFGLTSVNVNL
jgi:hypothetical protein